MLKKYRKRWRAERATFKKSNIDFQYDIDYDEDLIEQSIWAQYHLDPDDQADLLFSHWIKAIAGLKPDSLLCEIAKIRAEKDPKRIKQFGEYEHKIRREWNEFKMNKIKSDPKLLMQYQQQKIRDDLAFKNAMLSMFKIKGK